MSEVTYQIDVEVVEAVPEKDYSRDGWPKSAQRRVVYYPEKDQLYFIEEYGVSVVYNAKAFGFIKLQQPQLADGTEYLLQALAVAVHNRKMQA